MGLYFRKRIRILPGIYINFSKSGISFSFGGRGLSYTVGKKGTRKTVGIPGTGIRWTSYKKHGRGDGSGNI